MIPFAYANGTDPVTPERHDYSIVIILTVVTRRAMLSAGVQAATRPRAGLSPPDHPERKGSIANLLSPETADHGHLSKEARNV